MARVLLVDDEESMLCVLTTLLKAKGFDVLSAPTSEEAHAIIRAEELDLMISDIRMSPIDGMKLLTWARAERPEMSVIMLTAYGTVKTAIEAMKLGAFDYVTKPFKVDELLITIQRALDYRRAITENLDLKAQVSTRYRLENIVAESAAMKAVCELIERIAPTDTTIMICGESGTGKELVAKAIHAHSKRKEKRFLAVNCAALPDALLESEMFGHVKGAFTGASLNKKGLFEAAQGGTLFLDEIGSIPLSMQGKLLRVLQEKEIRRVGGTDNIAVDARVLAATNSDLEALMAAGEFREDLYYRLNVIPITIAPLRERPEDIIPLANHVLRKEVGEGAKLPELSQEVRAILQRYSWSGNVRELENAIKHALTLANGKEITPDVLPPKIVNDVGHVVPDREESLATQTHQFDSLRAFLRNKERMYLQRVLDGVGGDKERAAHALGVSLATLYRKLTD